MINKLIVKYYEDTFDEKMHGINVNESKFFMVTRSFIMTFALSTLFPVLHTIATGPKAYYPIEGFKIMLPILIFTGFIPFFFNIRIFARPLSKGTFFSLLFAPLYLLYYITFLPLLHKCLSGKNERNQEIKAYQDVVTKDRESRIKTYRDTMRDFKTEFKNDIDSFLKTHLQYSQSFKRFFLERITADGEINELKLTFLMLIPRVKTMPIDILREIVLSANFKDDYRWLGNETKELLYLKPNVDELFKDFSIEQIKSIFTRHYNPESYLSLLKNAVSINLENKNFTPVNNMEDLIAFAPVTKTMNEAKMLHPYLKQLHTFLPQYEVKILITKADYIEASSIFINCVQSLYKKKSNIFTLSNASGPVACVEIMQNKILEISGHRNGFVSFKVKKEIKAALKKARTTRKDAA